MQHFFFFWIVSILFLGLVLFFFFNFVVLVATSINRPCVERAIDGFGDQGSKVFQVYFIFFFFFLEEKNVILVLVYSISEKDKIKLAEQRDCILRRLLYQEKEATLLHRCSSIPFAVNLLRKFGKFVENFDDEMIVSKPRKNRYVEILFFFPLPFDWKTKWKTHIRIERMIYTVIVSHEYLNCKDIYLSDYYFFARLVR